MPTYLYLSARLLTKARILIIEQWDDAAFKKQPIYEFMKSDNSPDKWYVLLFGSIIICLWSYVFRKYEWNVPVEEARGNTKLLGRVSAADMINFREMLWK